MNKNAFSYPEAIRARDCATAILCKAGRLSPARLARGGIGAAQAAERWEANIVADDVITVDGVGLVDVLTSMAVGTNVAEDDVFGADEGC